MKGIFLLPVLYFILIASYSQQYMQLDSMLVSHAQPIAVNTQGIMGKGTLMKYRFGVYRVESIKSGLSNGKEETTTRKGLVTVKGEQKGKVSFSLIAHEKDTLKIEATYHRNTEKSYRRVLTLTYSGIHRMPLEGYETMFYDNQMMATIVDPGGRGKWRLNYSDRYAQSEDQDMVGRGSLDLEDNVIGIFPVKSWVGGDQPKFYSNVGYAFYRGKECIGAVQASVNTFTKKWVWLRDDLIGSQRDVMAAAFVLMLSYVNNDLQMGIGFGN